MNSLPIQDVTNYSLAGHKAEPLLTTVPEYPDRGIVTGLHQSIIRFCIWVNIFWLITTRNKNLVSSVKKTKQLLKIRNTYREQSLLFKYAKASGRYFFNYNAPGWPSKAFSRYVHHQISKTDHSNKYNGIHTLIFGITNKCSYSCEHCFEWKNLNRPESLHRDQLLSIIKKFQRAGVSQIQLSGGEPLNRLEDVIYLLQHADKGTDFWIYTSGYHLSYEKAGLLKAAGLTGLAVSLDHWDESLHNKFRGNKAAFKWAVEACANAAQNGLAVCLSLCATKQFVTADNLRLYAELALKLKASFIQVLEPKAVGHYDGMDVSLSTGQISILEDFYRNMNFTKAYEKYPAVAYHGFYSRRLGCAGSAADYLYVDMDGQAHPCPFCRKQSFNVLSTELSAGFEMMKTTGCVLFPKTEKGVL